MTWDDIKDLPIGEFGSEEFKLLKKEAENGNKYVQHGMGNYYQINAEKNLHLAKEWHMKAMDNGHEGSEESIEDIEKILQIM